MAAAGPTVVLTRAAADNAPLAALLQQAGATVAQIATAAVRTTAVEPDRQAVQAWLATAELLAFSSRHGVAAFLEHFGAQPLQRRGLKIAAVGESTARALTEAGAFVDVQAREPATGAGLAKAISAVLRVPSLVVAVQPRVAQGDLARELLARGHDVRAAVVYENVPPPAPPPHLHELAGPDAVVFAAAPSAVQRLLAWHDGWRQARWVAIGPTTAAALHATGIEPAAVAASADLSACAAAIWAAAGSPATATHPASPEPS